MKALYGTTKVLYGPYIGPVWAIQGGLDWAVYCGAGRTILSLCGSYVGPMWAIQGGLDRGVRGGAHLAGHVECPVGVSVGQEGLEVSLPDRVLGEGESGSRRGWVGGEGGLREVSGRGAEATRGGPARSGRMRSRERSRERS